MSQAVLNQLKVAVLTDKQQEANALLGSDARHILLYGGSRSGKTWLLVRAVCIRAMRASGSSHVILRFRFNHIKSSIIAQTFPDVMRKCFPNIKYRLDKTDWFAEFQNGSKIWFGGLDDKERTEKILGQEHATIYLNECSQIAYDARNKAATRLAQKCLIDGTGVNGVEPRYLPLKAYYDENPPTVGHWTYKMFIKKVEPKSGEAFKKPEQYVSLNVNPIDNLDNLPEEYIEILEALPEKDKQRFLRGKFLEQVDNALWTQDLIDRHRRAPEQVPFLTRISVNVDPSGCEGEDDFRSDEIGITVTGKDAQSRGYLLEDATGRYSPKQWAMKVKQMYQKWGADIIIAERNYGGAMVENTIRAQWASAPIKVISASRGKVQRAEPVSLLYGDPNWELNPSNIGRPQPLGRIFHVGHFPDLEDQLCNFSSNGYEGGKSPDRADSMIWGFTELLVSGSSYTLANVG
jgi:phage terminase large subunit-like protein